MRRSRKLYTYSPDGVTFVEASWAWPMMVSVFVLVAIITCIGSLVILQYGDDGTHSRSAASLKVENDIMNYQLRHLGARLNKLDREAEQLEALFAIHGQLIGQERRLRLSVSEQSLVVVHIPSDRPLHVAGRSAL